MTLQLRKKSGLYTLRNVAHAACTAVVKFGPYLKIYFANRPSLGIALDAMGAVCSDVIREIDSARADEFPP